MTVLVASLRGKPRPEHQPNNHPGRGVLMDALMPNIGKRGFSEPCPGGAFKETTPAFIDVTHHFYDRVFLRWTSKHVVPMGLLTPGGVEFTVTKPNQHRKNY